MKGTLCCYLVLNNFLYSVHCSRIPVLFYKPNNPQKLPLSVEGSQAPSNVWFFGLTRVSLQMASRLVQPFLLGTFVWPTQRENVLILPGSSSQSGNCGTQEKINGMHCMVHMFSLFHNFVALICSSLRLCCIAGTEERLRTAVAVGSPTARGECGNCWEISVRWRRKWHGDNRLERTTL